MVSVEGTDALVPVMASDVAHYARELERGLSEVRRALSASRFRRLSAEAEIPTLHPDSAKLWVAQLRLPAGGGAGEERVRLALMEVRRGLPGHAPGASEPEFGGVDPRLCSPVWVRVADFDIDEGRALLVVTLMRHTGARVQSNRWQKVDEFVRRLDHEAISVDLRREAR